MRLIRFLGMCGRYTLKMTPTGIVSFFDERFEARVEGDLQEVDRSRYNVAPTQLVMTVAIERGERVARPTRWGIYAPWSSSGNLINARAEKLGSSKYWAPMLATGRVLIPADGFYEWKAIGGRKVPYWFSRTDECPFAFAGLVSTWTDPQDGEQRRGCVVLTTPPNDLIADLHDRMPAILAPGSEQSWLEAEPAEALSVLNPLPSKLMTARPVSTIVNSADVDAPECIEAVEAEPPDTLF